MKNFTKILLAALLVVSFAASAQDEEESSTPVLSISGSVDAYFRSNLSPTNYGNQQAPGSSFANQNGFALGMANVIIGLEGEKTGFVADLVYGPRGTDAVFGATTASSSIVNQLYAYWMVSDAVTLSMGNFNTYLGYEVISPTANFNYSTSYMFSYGPFSHSGVKADFSLGEASLMVGVFNPTDMTDFNPVDTYTIGAQVGFGGAYLNLLYGDQDGSMAYIDGDGAVVDNSATFQIDLTAGWDLSDALYFGVNATYNTTGSNLDGVDPFGFYGAAGYLQYSLSDAFALGTRIEYFGEFEGGAGAIGGYDADGKASVVDVTLTAQYTVGGLTFIPELRLDAASEDVFSDGSEATGSMSSFVLAAVYAF
ncbi:outer membrane beta-barrel protein [Reichenbachiella sp. MSK19-1]|uniref:outer membrane beta-barrel protein n=1 Tax=Reichenbachiella sp. MSK19-1 TaxID=1897631 RepID=UPI001628ACF2|nr:outer membrane beta-barrel protein [Reichenbachiella sp. MSK19-1]